MLQKASTISSHVGHRFLAHMAPFGDKHGSVIDLAQLATDIESREMKRLFDSGTRVLMLNVSCLGEMIALGNFCDFRKRGIMCFACEAMTCSAFPRSAEAKLPSYPTLQNLHQLRVKLQL